MNSQSESFIKTNVVIAIVSIYLILMFFSVLFFSSTSNNHISNTTTNKHSSSSFFTTLSPFELFMNSRFAGNRPNSNSKYDINDPRRQQELRQRREIIIDLVKEAWKKSNNVRGEKYLPFSNKNFRNNKFSVQENSEFSSAAAGTALIAHDAIDTLILLGLEKEAQEAMNLAMKASPVQNGVLVSEVVQRFVGSMLGAYSLTGEKKFLERALYHASTVRASAFLVSSSSGNNNNRHNDMTRRIPQRYVSIRGQQDETLLATSTSSSSAITKMFPFFQGDNRCVISEIFSLSLPFSFLSSVTTDTSFEEQGTRFQRWLLESDIFQKRRKNNAERRRNKKVDEEEEEEEENEDGGEYSNLFLEKFSDPKFDIITSTNEVETSSSRKKKNMKKKKNKNKKPTTTSAAKIMTSGLLPCFVDCEKGLFSGSFTLNRFGIGQVESYLKQWIFLKGKKISSLKNNNNQKNDNSRNSEDEEELEEIQQKLTQLSQLYENAIDTIITHLLKYSSKKHFAFIGSFSIDFDPSIISSTSDFCRIPGILALGLIHGIHSSKNKNKNYYDWDSKSTQIEALASDLLTSCVSILYQTPSRLMPETVRVSSRKMKKNFGSLKKKMKMKRKQQQQQEHSLDEEEEEETFFTFANEKDRKASLKSGLVESLFYMYRYTKDEGLREIGFEMLNAYKHFASNGAILKDVMKIPNLQQEKNVDETENRNVEFYENEIEPDYLSQTLKFLFLLFSDTNVVPLDKFVFDFGGHPLSIF